MKNDTRPARQSIISGRRRLARREEHTNETIPAWSCLQLIAVSALVYDFRTIHGQQPGTRREVTSAATPAITETPKGKMLVEKLPEAQKV
jgi:hypothetical protein